MNYNIVRGTVTRNAPTERQGTPNWLKALYAVLTALVLITLIGALI